MIYTHTIGRIGKDCKTITGAHGTFIAVDMAVDELLQRSEHHHMGKSTQQQREPYPFG